MKRLIILFLFFSANHVLFADTLVVAKTGNADFRTVQEALNAIKPRSVKDEGWTVVLVKSGVYKEKVVLPYDRNFVKIIGESPESTVISWNDHTGKVVDGDTINTYSSYTFSIRGNHVIVANLTIENTAGRVGQAVACETQGDCIAFYNCRIISDQDTFFTKGAVARVYVKNCFISGTTDFIFGPSIAVFDSCEIFCKKNSYITAASTTENNTFGYVFRDCRITADTSVSKIYLGRPWRSFAKTVFLHCELDLPIRPEGWHHWIPERERTAYYAEYQCYGKGSDTSKRVHWSHQLSDKESAIYTLENIFAKGTVSEPFAKDWKPLY